MSPHKRGGGYLAQADRSDLASLDHTGKGADRLLNRHGLVEAVQIVEVDDIGLQARKTGLDRGQQRLRPAIDHTLAVDAGHPAFGGEDELLSASRQGLADQDLVGPKAV